MAAVATAANRASAEVATQMAAGPTTRKGAALLAAALPPKAAYAASAAGTAAAQAPIISPAAQRGPPRPSHRSAHSTSTIPGG